MSQFIKDFRVKHPQYNDLNDDQLVGALHTKFYSDIPIEQFHQKINYSQAVVEPEVIEPKKAQQQQGLITPDGFTGAAKKIESEPRNIQSDPIVPDGFAAPDQKEPQYDTFTEATGKAIDNVPERFQQSLAGLIQLSGEDMALDKRKYIDERAQRLGLSTQDYNLIAWAGQNGLIDPKMGINEALPYIKENLAKSLSEEQLADLANKSIINPDDISAYAKEWREETNKTMQPINAEPNSIAYYGSAAIGSVAEMTPALIASVLTRNPQVGMRMVAGQVAGQSYAEGREQGLDEGQAQKYAVLSAAAEAIPEYVPIKIILDPAKGFLKKLGQTAIAESLQEMITESLKIGLDKDMINEDMTWQEARSRLIDAGVVGSMAGPLMTTVAEPAVRAQKAIQEQSAINEIQNKEFDTTAQQEAIKALTPEGFTPMIDLVKQKAEELQAQMPVMPIDQVTSEPEIITNKTTVSTEALPAVEDIAPTEAEELPEGFEVEPTLKVKVFRGLREGVGELDQNLTWFSADKKLAKGYSNGNVVERELSLEKVLDLGQDKQIITPRTFANRAINQAKGNGLSKKEILLIRDEFLDKFKNPDAETKIINFWANKNGKEDLKDFFEDLRFDAVKLIEEGADTYGVINPSVIKENKSIEKTASDFIAEKQAELDNYKDKVAKGEWQQEAVKPFMDRLEQQIEGLNQEIKEESESNSKQTKANEAIASNSKQLPVVNNKEFLDSPYKTGESIELFFAKNKEKAPLMNGMDMGQEIEPAGDYLVTSKEDMQDDNNKWEYGKVKFKNPLVMENKTTSSKGWKKDLSEMFGGKTGKSLAEEVKKAGYDGIVTIEKYKGKYELSETVDLMNQRSSKNKPSSNGIKTQQAKTKHSKSGIDLFVVKMIDRVDRAKFTGLKAEAKKYGGYYSTYTKHGAIAGWQFKTQENADQFEAVLNGTVIDKQEQQAQPTKKAKPKPEVKKADNSEKLIKIAEKMEEKANEELNQPRQTNTARRASMAAGAIQKAEKKVALAKTLKNIAEGLKAGELVQLGKISSVAQLENLISLQQRSIPSRFYENGSFDGYSISRPMKKGVTIDDYIDYIQYPEIRIYDDNKKLVALKLEDKKGFKRLASEITRLQRSRQDFSKLPEETYLKLKEAIKKGHIDEYDIGGFAADQYNSIARLKRMGIENQKQLQEAIRELDSLSVKAKGVSKIKKLEMDLVGKKIAGYFPTPKPLVEKMLDYAAIQEGDKVLEPSAGKGNIAEQIKETEPKADLSVIEYNDTLRGILKEKGFNVIGTDFLQEQGKYDKIIMNPPFENGQDIDHVRHAYDLLEEGGTLVSIMGAGVKNTRKKSVEFQEWVEEQGSYIEDLPAGSFKDSDRSTGVSTVMVVLEKPKQSKPKQSKQSNTLALEDSYETQPAQGEQFNAVGANYIGLYRSSGIPARQEFIVIDGKRLDIPKTPQRIEPIKETLVSIMGRRIYEGKVKGKSRLGFYRHANGELRTKKKNDVEVLAHEMAHYLDFYSNETLPNFEALYLNPRYRSEVDALSYTDSDTKTQSLEGFAEFVRLWLTNSPEAKLRAPNFYDAFNILLRKDKKLYVKMFKLRGQMHKFYFQGPDLLGQALIGNKLSLKDRYNQWIYRRDSMIRQEIFDKYHAARKVEQELTGKISNAEDSAWKQFRIANGGAEGIADYILNYGTINFAENGDLEKSGKSLFEVFEPVKKIKLLPEHKGTEKIDLFLRYMAGRRALELHRQGRENLIPKETALEWAALSNKYPEFDNIRKEYQAFNGRMMDFYEKSGLVTPQSRKLMQSLNKDYIPFNRIRDQLAGGKTSSAGGLQRLKGGTANLNDMLVNIQDGVVSNVRAALTNKAKQRLYGYISNHKDGAIFATKLAPDSKPVKVFEDEMTAKIGKILALNGIEGEVDIDIPDLLTFWQHGIKPTTNESGNVVDTVVIEGKPRYYEVQDPLLQEMLISMNPESYSSFMNIMFGAKNLFTRSITLGVEFMGANLVRDTVGAAFLSKNNFKPFIDSFRGMYHFFRKDQMWQDFVRAGGGYSSRLDALNAESKARRRVKLDEFGVMTIPEKTLATIDHIASAFEYGTRIGEFRLAKKKGKSNQQAGFEAREISTDFSSMGSNHFLAGYIRTVPFLNAMIQSQDRVFREAIIKKKYDGNPIGLAMKATLGITIPTLVLYLMNKDDEDYQQIPEHEKRTNWHIKLPNGQFAKIPRPYDVGFIYATMPELFFKYLEDEKGKEFADGMIWTLGQMYGIDGTPAVLTGIMDIYSNEKWTGAPVVPYSLKDVSAVEQYNTSTSEIFVRLGKQLNMSPIKAEHAFKAYTGYLGGYLLWGTEQMLWDESKLGPQLERKAENNIFLRRFLTPEVRPNGAAMEKFFNIKEQSDRVVADYRAQVDIRRALKGGSPEMFQDDSFFGLTSTEKKVLFELNDSMNQVIKIIYGKEGMKTAENAIIYNPKLTAKEKRDKADKLWQQRNALFLKAYNAANRALEAAEEQSKKFKQE